MTRLTDRAEELAEQRCVDPYTPASLTPEIDHYPSMDAVAAKVEQVHELSSGITVVPVTSNPEVSVFRAQYRRTVGKYTHHNPTLCSGEHLRQFPTDHTGSR
jgi:hypothetical protein